MISIEIPVKWGMHIDEQLEAIRGQTYQDYEVIIAFSVLNNALKDTLQEYDIKIVKCGPNLLDARYSAHNSAKGDFSLLLDETRIPSSDLLKTLHNEEKDIIVINEQDIGNNFWTTLSNLDKLNSLECNKIDMSAGYVLPRYFRSSILSESFDRIRKNLDDDTFKSVLFEDHQLISFEAFKISNSFAIIKDVLLYHYGDTSLISIFKKYHRYGKSHSVLKNTNYEPILNPKKRIRNICHGSRLKLTIFYAARGIPFLIGYYLI